MTIAKIKSLLGKFPALDCQHAQGLMSPFIDSMTSEAETQLLEAHVAGCGACRRQLHGYVSLRNLIVGLPAPPVPEDLALETRIRLSHARSANFRLRIRAVVENTLKPYALPAISGVLATCLCFVLLLGSFGSSLAATTDAVSVLWVQSPRAAEPLMLQLAELGLDDVTVDVAIDQRGQAFSTVIHNGPTDPELDRWLRDVLLLGKFYPATIHGLPVRSRLIMSFVGVRGSPLA